MGALAGPADIANGSREGEGRVKHGLGFGLEQLNTGVCDLLKWRTLGKSDFRGKARVLVYQSYI